MPDDQDDFEPASKGLIARDPALQVNKEDAARSGLWQTTIL